MKLGLQEEREQKSHLDRVEQNKTKTRMCSCLGSGSRRGGAQSPLARHLLSLLLVPAHFGRVQFLRGRGGAGLAGGVLRYPHSQRQGPASHRTGPKQELPEGPAAGALVVQWAGTSQRKGFLGDIPGPQPKAAPPPLLAHAGRRLLPSTAKGTTVLRYRGIDWVPAGPDYRRSFMHRWR